MIVTEEDREYMRRIGCYKALSHAEAAAAHAAKSLSERLQASWELSVRHRDRLAARKEAEWETIGALAFYERARELGLYTP